MIKRILLLFFLPFLLLPADIFAQNSNKVKVLKKQKALLQKQISASESLLKVTKTDVKTQLMQVSTLSNQIEDQNQYLQQVNGEITSLSGEISLLEKQLVILQNELSQARVRYEKSAQYMRRNRSIQNQLVFIFSANRISQMYRRLRYVKEYAAYQRVQGEKIEKQQREIQLKQSQLFSVKSEKNRLAYEGAAQRDEMEGKKQQQQVLVEGLKKKQKNLTYEISKKKKQSEALDAKIDAVIAQEIAEMKRKQRLLAARKAEEMKRKAREQARRLAAQKAAEDAKRLAEARALEQKALADKKAAARKSLAEKKAAEKALSEAKAARKAAQNKASFDAKAAVAPAESSESQPFILSEDYQLNGSFESNKGRLSVPITGPYFIAGRFGSYNVPGLSNVRLDNKGVNYVGKPGAHARAIFGGEVSAVFQFGATKNILIRHGSYISVYCNLSSVSVSQGAHVGARQVIGTVANDGSGNCVLQFQLRKETAKLNPEAWIAR